MSTKSGRHVLAENRDVGQDIGFHVFPVCICFVCLGVEKGISRRPTSPAVLLVLPNLPSSFEGLITIRGEQHLSSEARALVSSASIFVAGVVTAGHFTAESDR